VRVCACVRLSQGGKEKAELYIFVSVRISQYISEYFRLRQYILGQENIFLVLYDAPIYF